MRRSRDWFWLEVLALLVVLVSGAALRYWLSTALPFDAAELEALAEASVRDRGMRVPFIMFNGASLFALYLLLRHCAGPPAAFTGLLLLQTSLTFQQQALRIRWTALVILVVVVALTLWSFSRPAWRPPRPAARALAVLALGLALRGLAIGAGLPARLVEIRRDSAADPARLYQSLRTCGGGEITPLDRIRACDLAWPERRSLAQQEALLRHAQRLGRIATAVDGSRPPPSGDGPEVAVLDRTAVALFAVEPGQALATTLQVVRAKPESPSR